ncbi:hypothetical protein EROM_101510 [Encephalitozoon romaleae SJ-2008]|uniref:Symplekin C-terminal domain-containing protein n=1 Tax=Encephalitozoon romaleae (strain SJ-2008) TaxID=1178016 RepID=I6ZW30_ENCRO|nr:hypothetical protein EROM_101510 [Encephalitozoon romaleae SJ-2008]AFN83966.1 hypothetical protein EROM_101510 [Encephalitozoon romaleae SJ-2008]
MMSLELTRENINAVSLELVKNKRMFDKNVNYVMSFMIKAFPERTELLSRIKVLNIKSKAAKKIDLESDIMDQIAMNVFAIKNINEGSFMKNMLTLFKDPSSFSKVFLTYFYSNSSLGIEKTDEILDKLVELLLEESSLKESFEGFINGIGFSEYSESISSEKTEEMGKELGTDAHKELTYKASNDESSSTAISLISLDDSEEIRRIDTSISLLFEGRKKKLSPLSLKTCARVLSIMNIILENNYPGCVDVVPVLMYISKIDQVIFKRSLSALKTILKKINYKDKGRLFEMFCDLLGQNPNMIRMTMLIANTCGDYFSWPEFLESVDRNEEVDLDMIDRTCIPRPSFYEFIVLTENPGRYLTTAKNIIKNETDIHLLRDLGEKINDTELGGIKQIKSAIDSRIKALSHEECPKKQKRSGKNRDN